MRRGSEGGVKPDCDVFRARPRETIAMEMARKRQFAFSTPQPTRTGTPVLQHGVASGHNTPLIESATPAFGSPTDWWRSPNRAE